jgi:hypothetical protein
LPAPTTESPSSKDRLQSQESFTADTTDGSGQGTSSDRSNQRPSSEVSAQKDGATQAQPGPSSKRNK